MDGCIYMYPNILFAITSKTVFKLKERKNGECHGLTNEQYFFLLHCFVLFALMKINSIRIFSYSILGIIFFYLNITVMFAHAVSKYQYIEFLPVVESNT